jgi:hypothetical protein
MKPIEQIFLVLLQQLPICLQPLLPSALDIAQGAHRAFHVAHLGHEHVFHSEFPAILWIYRSKLFIQKHDLLHLGNLGVIEVGDLGSSEPVELSDEMVVELAEPFILVALDLVFLVEPSPVSVLHSRRSFSH